MEFFNVKWNYYVALCFSVYDVALKVINFLGEAAHDRLNILLLIDPTHFFIPGINHLQLWEYNTQY